MLIGAPRTGTNYLLNLLWHHQDVYVSSEVFHPEKAFGMEGRPLAEFGKLSGLEFEGIDDPRLLPTMEISLEKLVRSFRSLESEGKNCFVFKVFPGHLNPYFLKKLMLLVDKTIFVKRRVLDSYISVVKSELTREFYSRDTTSILPSLNTAHFLRWHGWTSNWYCECYRTWIDVNQNTDIPILFYEDFTRATNEQNLSFLLSKFRSRFRISLGDSVVRMGETLLRQDRENNPDLKVSNYHQFICALEEQNMKERVFGYF